MDSSSSIDSQRLEATLRFLDDVRCNRTELSARERRALLTACTRLTQQGKKSVLPECASRAHRKEVRTRELERALQNKQERGMVRLGDMADEQRDRGESRESRTEEEDVEDVAQQQLRLRESGHTQSGVVDDEIIASFMRCCYICKSETGMEARHDHYRTMCVACGAFNLERRLRTCSGMFDGRTALVTGGRVKIGFEITLKLLRSGCRVIVTTRFPTDARQRFASHPAFESFRDRLTVIGADLSSRKHVLDMCETVSSMCKSLDFIIHNAAQTLRRPREYYQSLLDVDEDGGKFCLATPMSSASSSLVCQSATELFPAGVFDEHGQQIDLSLINSWRLRLEAVSVEEVEEVHHINAIAPFIINMRLLPLMCAKWTGDKHIVHVSAVEGQFYRLNKTPRHPHTNMAKASLNMMTRTCAQDLIKLGIHVNSVDTGWCSNMNPEHIQVAQQVSFVVPLDCVDGAARVLDPIFEGFRTGRHDFGKFWKDYEPTMW